MSPQIAKTMLQMAFSLSDEAYDGQSCVAYEWETDCEYRVLLVLDTGDETDIVFNRVTRTYRVWRNLTEWGPAGDN